MIHLVYATDKRTALEKLEKPALAINNDLVVKTGVDGQGKDILQVTSRAPQIHDMESPEKVDVSDPNILYAAEWDGKAPYITVLKGQISDLKMAYLGWPMVTQAEWEAANPVEKP